MTEGIDKALAEVWRRSGPLLEERLAGIELGIDQLSGEVPGAPLSGGGRDQAHMLAGVLGTFGLDRGTTLARDLEQHLDCPQAVAEAARLADVAAELRALVDGAVVV
jgi:HPt (histidine-containing phosphotransfer) domain-containing protein